MFKYNIIENEIYKNAGLIKVPKKMKKEIVTFLKACASNQKVFGGAFTYSKKIKMDLSDMPDNYNPELLQQAADSIGGRLIVNIVYKNQEGISTGGLFDPGTNPPSISIFPHGIELSRCSVLIEHELIHFIQHLLKISVNIKLKKQKTSIKDSIINSEEFKKLTKSKDYINSSAEEKGNIIGKFIEEYLIKNKTFRSSDYYLGFPKEFDLDKFINLMKAKADERIYYDNPVEFFTHLNDSIHDFKKLENKNFKQFINGEIGSAESKLFWKAIGYNEKMYNRAVKELYKAMLAEEEKEKKKKK